MNWEEEEGRIWEERRPKIKKGGTGSSKKKRQKKKKKGISSYIWVIDLDHENSILLIVFVKRVGSSSVHEWDDEREYWDEKERKQ